MEESTVNQSIDVLESALWRHFPDILSTLLQDHTTHRNIIWGTDDYASLGKPYQAKEEILPELIIGEHERLIMPRVKKEKELQSQRIRDMAEVFTPTWVCNEQNNLVDEAWFGRKDVFNSTYIDNDGNHCWEASKGKIIFYEEPSRKSKRSWHDYVRDLRLEITCGEGPYLASRYDRVTGDFIENVNQRVGILDRKLRVVSENTESTGEWLEWAKEALMATYGYEWQGDNLLLARETMLFTFLDFFKAKFGSELSGAQMQSLPGAADIISWNLWQMDGLKMVVPYSCEGQTETDLFGEILEKKCPACENGSYTNHIGKHCLIRDWSKPKDKQTIEFQLLLTAANK